MNDFQMKANLEYLTHTGRAKAWSCSGDNIYWTTASVCHDSLAVDLIIKLLYMMGCLTVQDVIW